jgi:hypothetical protein
MLELEKYVVKAITVTRVKIVLLSLFKIRKEQEIEGNLGNRKSRAEVGFDEGSLESRF